MIATILITISLASVIAGFNHIKTIEGKCQFLRQLRDEIGIVPDSELNRLQRMWKDKAIKFYNKNCAK